MYTVLQYYLFYIDISILCISFFEYSYAKNKAPVAGNVLITVGVSPLYRARTPSLLYISIAVRINGAETPATY